jgi:F-type H+-transporting ATPase subunit epsilon
MSKKNQKKFQLKIVFPDKELKQQEVDFLVIPSIDGDIGVKPNHTPFLSALRPGIIYIHRDESKEEISVVSGFVEVINDKVIILLSE